MKTLLRFALLWSCSFAALAQTSIHPSDGDWRAGEMIVRFRAPADPKIAALASGKSLPVAALPPAFRAVHQTNAIASIRPLVHPAWANRVPADSPIHRTYVFQFSDSKADIKQLSRSLAQGNEIEYAEPNYRFKVSFIPNDPFFSSSGTWGQPYDDQWALKIAQVPDAWDFPTATNDVLVAIVDTGIDFTHPDLAGNIATNGWNFLNNTADPTDDHGHGTFCAGIIGAVLDNNLGMAGIGRHVKILPLKFLDSTGFGSADAAASAIYYAFNNGAKIINLSFGGGDSQTLHYAIDDAHTAQAVLVASAGNNASPYLAYPASYRNVITVGASDHQDHLADFSNFGPRIDVVAPGGDSGGSNAGNSILSLRAANTTPGTPLDSLYTRWRGTSFSAPFVAGVVSLMRSQKPNLDNERIRQILRTTADDVADPGWDLQTGYGRVNALAAMRVTNAIITIINYPENFDYVHGTMRVDATLYRQPPGYWVIEWGAGQVATNWTMLASNSVTVVYGGTLAWWDTTQVPDGDYSIRLRSWTTNGSRFEDRVVVTVYNALYNFDPPAHPGWPTNAGLANASAPIMADVDGDGKKEILWGVRKSFVIKRADGTTFNTWPISGSPRGPPSIADLDGDGQPEIGLISDGDVHDGSADQIGIWHADGTPLPGWPKTFVSADPFAVDDVCPVFADMDGDGQKDVIWCSADESNHAATVVHVDRLDGSPVPGWPITLPASAGLTFMPPAVGDIDGDGKLDICVMTESGQIYLLHHDGRVFDGWPVTLAGGGLAGAPALADIDHDGELEVFAETYGGWVCCYKANGQIMPGWPRQLDGITWPAAFGDLDGDGKLEIAVGLRANDMTVRRYDGQLLPGWPPKYGGGWFMAPVIADIDHDGYLDVLSADHNGYVRAWNSSGQELYSLGFPIQATDGQFGCYSGPVVGDINGDGSLQVLVFGDSDYGMWDLGTRINPELMPWPTMLGDNAHQSRYQVPPKLLSVSPNYAVTNQSAQLTINGDNFLKGMRVFLDNMPQSVISETVTTVTFTISGAIVPKWYALTVSNVNSSASTLARAVAVFTTADGDDDGDGLPNLWEAQHGLDPFDNGTVNPANGPNGDPDHDGASNWAEYIAGTDPQDPTSVFKILTAVPNAGGIAISWSSAAAKNYTIYRAAEVSGPFVTITNGLPATPPVNTFIDTTAAGLRTTFYRVGVH